MGWSSCFDRDSGRNSSMFSSEFIVKLWLVEITVWLCDWVLFGIVGVALFVWFF